MACDGVKDCKQAVIGSRTHSVIVASLYFSL